MSSRKVAAGVVAAAALCVLALSACGHGGTIPGTGPSGGIGAGGPAPSATDGGGGGGGGGGATGTAPAITFPTTAEQYTKNAIEAWADKNTATLNQYESANGVLHDMLNNCSGCYNTQFSLAPGFCQGAAGSSYCLYFNTFGDKLQLRVDNQLLGQAHAMGTGSTFEPTTFPADDKAYATQALQAWNDGNDNRLKLLTQNELTSAGIDAMGVQRGSDWTFENCQGAAGSTFCQFGRGGRHLNFQFSNLVPNPPTSGPDAQHRIVSVSVQG